MKRWSVKLVDVKNLPTKAEEAPSPHEVRLATGHQPSILMSQGDILMSFP